MEDIFHHVRKRYPAGRLGLLGSNFSGNAAILTAARLAAASAPSR